MAEVLQPTLRFPEFEGDWITETLGNPQIASFSKGKGITKDDIVDDGEVKCIRYGELYTEYGEIIDEIVSSTNIPVEDLVLSEANDVIIPASGETILDIATASCVLHSDIALGGDLNIIKPVSTNGVFLAYYLNNAKKRDIASLAQGISVIHLYSSQLKTLKVNLPESEEQQKIANFLKAIDKRIQLLKDKKEGLEDYKKSIMQKLFSQEIRFKKDDSSAFPDWEEKRFHEISYKISSNIAANSLDDNHGDFKIYGATGFLQYVDFYSEEEEYISIVKDGAGVGRVLLCDAYSSVLGTLDIIKAKEDNILKFLFELLSRMRFEKYVSGSTIPHIYFKDYSMEKVFVPHPDEQYKIALFANSIDKKIIKHSCELDQLLIFKKSVLQKMFV